MAMPEIRGKVGHGIERARQLTRDPVFREAALLAPRGWPQSIYPDRAVTFAVWVRKDRTPAGHVTGKKTRGGSL